MKLAERADALLREATLPDAPRRVPGVVAAAVTREGELLYQGAFGERRLGGGVPMTPDTVVWIASMTKALTSFAAVQLVDQGRLALDEPAARVLPEIDRVPVLAGFDATRRPVLRPPARPVTLRDLLTHSSGFSYETWNADMSPAREALGLPSNAARKRASLALPLAFDPGTRWEYGIGIDWAGLMVEAVTGLRLGAYLQQHVFAPLGMHDTAFTPTATMQPRLATVHRRAANGALELPAPAAPVEPDYDPGGGGLHSTVGDYLRFIRLVLGGGALDGVRLLSEKSMPLLTDNQIGALRVQPMRSAQPARSNDAEFFPGLPKSWSLAFQRNESPAPTGRAAGTLMWAGLGNTYYWIDPTTGVGGVLATQILPFADRGALDLFTAFETAVYDSLR